MNDSSQTLIDDTTKKLDDILNAKLGDISEKTTQYIVEVESSKKDAQKRFESFLDRKKVIDYLVYLNLGLTPILLIILSYVIFFKK